MSERAVIKRQNVRVEAAPPRPVQRRSEGEAPCEKSVRVVEADGVVHALEVTCSCGETTVVELELQLAQPTEAPAPTPSAAPTEPPSAEEPIQESPAPEESIA